MSEKNKLAVFERMGVIASGVRWTHNALTFERVDEGTLVAAGAFLQAVDQASAWWWGDFLVEYCGYSLKSDEKEAGKAFDALTAETKLKQYTARYAGIAGREPKTLWHWRAVAEFFNSSRRREELSWTHHCEAKDGSGGDKAVADNWLDMAQQHGWSVSQLRAAIRKAKRAEREPEEPLPQMVLPMEIVAARRWAGMASKRVLAGDMPREEMAALLVEMEPLIAFARELARALSTGQNLPTPGGKESFYPAA